MTKKNEATLDPTGRFEKRDEILSARTSITTFAAYDTQTGQEVAWFEIDISNLDQIQTEIFFSDISRLKSIRHDAMINILASWNSNDLKKTFIVTEAIPPNSIGSQIRRGQLEVRLRALINWFQPLLEVLDFLHSQNPPIIHHRVSVNSLYARPGKIHVKLIPPLVSPFDLTIHQNEVKIRPTSPPESLYATTTSLSDIWSFGISLLCAITGKPPYQECQTPSKFIEKLSQYLPPDSLHHVTNPLARDLIAKCLVPPEHRPTAHELLQHDFFKQQNTDTIISPLQDDGIEIIYTTSSTGTGTGHDIPKV